MNNPAFATLILTSLATINSQAIITYVDASTANTTAITGWTVRGNGNGGAQGQYTSTDAANFANEGSVLELFGGAGNELVTTITGLDSGLTYTIFGFFWDAEAGAQAWDLAAGLSTGNYLQFGVNAAGDTSVGADTATVYTGSNVNGLNVLGQTPDDFTDNVDGNRRLWYGALGQVTGVTEVQVFINGGTTNLGTGNGSSGRTWYDGVGFEVVPEPSSAVLALVGSLFLVGRRRS